MIRPNWRTCAAVIQPSSSWKFHDRGCIRNKSGLSEQSLQFLVRKRGVLPLVTTQCPIKTFHQKDNAPVFDETGETVLVQLHQPIGVQRFEVGEQDRHHIETLVCLRHSVSLSDTTFLTLRQRFMRTIDQKCETRQNLTVIIMRVRVEEHLFVFPKSIISVQNQTEIRQIGMLAIGEDIIVVYVEMDHTVLAEKVDRYAQFVERPLYAIGIIQQPGSQHVRDVFQKQNQFAAGIAAIQHIPADVRIASPVLEIPFIALQIDTCGFTGEGTIR